MSVRYMLAGGISFGTALAISISYHVHESILIAIFHGVLGWLYVIWRMLTPG